MLKTLPESSFSDEEHLSETARVWRAVVMRALKDIRDMDKKGPPCWRLGAEAIQWILHSPDFLSVCDSAQMSGIIIRKRANHWLDSLSAQKRASILSHKGAYAVDARKCK
jgi:hypothetical protein